MSTLGARGISIGAAEGALKALSAEGKAVSDESWMLGEENKIRACAREGFF